jgi:hypothetical protein
MLLPDTGNAEGPIQYLPARMVYQALLQRRGGDGGDGRGLGHSRHYLSGWGGDFHDGANVWFVIGEGDHHDNNGFFKRMPGALR